MFSFMTPEETSSEDFLHIGMERIVPNRKSRRNSTGNFTIEHKVLSRYLRGSNGSCHDNCKPAGLDQATELKPTNPVPERSDRTHVEPASSVQRIKKLFSSIPKPSTRDVKTNTNSLKYQVKQDVIEPKRQDLKSKPKPKPKTVMADPFYIPPARVPRRRLSDIILPSNGLGAILDTPTVGSLSRSSRKSDSKTEPRKDSKPGNSVKIAVKTPGNGKNSRKVQALRAHYSSTKPEADQGSRKSKPTKSVEEVQEKSLHVLPDETAKTQNPTSPASSTNEEKALEHGRKEAQISSTLKKDETPQSNGQNNGVAAIGVKKAEKSTRVAKVAMENGERSPEKLKFNRGKIIDTESESSSPRKLKFGQGELLDENEGQGDGNGINLRRLASDGALHSPESHSVKVVLKRHNLEAKKPPLGLNNNVIEETASKLIQTRKSKVKALVGAFEMISTNDY